jgi:outer membrane protein assembly factor BamB
MLPLLAVAALAFASEKWPQFRGPGSTGVADDPALPDKWSATENVVWKTEIPGIGWSSPIVWGDNIFLTSVIKTGETETPKKGLYFGGERPASKDEHRWMVYAVDFKTGKILWEREVFKGMPPGPRHLKNSYASETPVTDGEHVYAYFGGAGVFCLDRNGKLLWSQPLAPLPMRFGWGTAASPVLHGGRLYIVNDNEEKSFLTAFDARTGKPVWRVTRDEGSNWATPFVWEHADRTEVVTAGTRRVRSYDLDGKLLWEFGGMSSIVIPTPFAKLGLLYVTSGYVGDQVRPVYAVRPGAVGDISLKSEETSSRFVAWHHPQAGPYNPSPIVYGDYYYTLLDRGFFTCHDARTGQEIYGKQRIDPAAGLNSVSTVSLASDGDTVYATTSSLYIASNPQWWYAPRRLPMVMPNAGSLRPAPQVRPLMPPQQTQIHRFDISRPGAPRYVASGEVSGRLLNQYSLSDYAGYLRVATTTGDALADEPGDSNAVSTSSSSVYVLRADTLTKVGELDGLGERQRIYAVRFIGALAYVVTFQQMDPLYTLDLRDPTAPRIAGTLELTGYSAYLHPAADRTLIGVGQEATAQGRPLGTQISLFDVSNPASPRRLPPSRSASPR